MCKVSAQSLLKCQIVTNLISYTLHRLRCYILIFVKQTDSKLMILTYCMRLYFGRDIMFDMNMFYMKTTALLDAIVVCYKRSVMCLVGSENRYGGFAAAGCPFNQVLYPRLFFGKFNFGIHLTILHDNYYIYRKFMRYGAKKADDFIFIRLVDLLIFKIVIITDDNV